MEVQATATVQALLNLADGVIPTVISRPTGWYFNGWFAFCMFGPFVVESERVTTIEPGGVVADSNVKNGRTEQRNKKRKKVMRYATTILQINVVCRCK
jgi:hypothetical protein